MAQRLSIASATWSLFPATLVACISDCVACFSDTCRLPQRHLSLASAIVSLASVTMSFASATLVACLSDCVAYLSDSVACLRFVYVLVSLSVYVCVGLCLCLSLCSLVFDLSLVQLSHLELRVSRSVLCNLFPVIHSVVRVLFRIAHYGRHHASDWVPQFAAAGVAASSVSAADRVLHRGPSPHV